MDKIGVINKALHSAGNPYQEGQPIRRFRWLHMRYETGRYYWVEGGQFSHFQWYWDRDFLNWRS